MGTIRGSGEADRKDKLPFGRQDGQLHDLALGQVLELNFTRTPGLTRVPTGELALERLEAEADRYNLIIASPAIRDMPAEKLAREVRRRGFDVPVVQVGERASARPVRVHEKHFVRPTRSD